MEKPLILKTEYSAYMANGVCDELPHDIGVDVGDIDIVYFNNGEMKVSVPHLRGRRVYAFHAPVIRGEYKPNDFVVTSMIIDDALRRSDARHITHVAPHIPYQRQDKQHEEHEPISAKRVMDVFYDGDVPIATRMLTFDMHAESIGAYANYPVRELYASPIYIRAFKNIKCILVGPDPKAGKLLEAVSKRMDNKPLAMAYKIRAMPGKSETKGLMGYENVEGSECALIIDDIIDTGGSIVGVADLLREIEPNLEIYAFCTHGVFSMDEQGTVGEKMEKAGVHVMTTDAIYRGAKWEDKNKWCKVYSVAPIIAEAIYRLETGRDVEEMFR